MKILLISPIPPPSGGIASWTKRYLDSDIAKEHEIILINTAVKGKRVKSLNKKNIFEEIYRNISIIRNVRKTCKKNNDINIAHLNTSCSKTGMFRDYFMIRILKKNKIKVLVHFRCDVTYMVQGKISNKILGKIVENADELLTLNEISRKYIKDNFKRDSKILPNFVSNEYIEVAKKEKIIDDDINNIVYTGHITKNKGCDMILKISRQFPDKKFKLIGYISDEFKDIDIPKNVEMIGEIPSNQIKMFLEKADIFLFPSHTEGFPNSVAEAMALGIPIIATPVGAIPDMIEKYGGILVEVDNENGFVEAINALANREKRCKMSEWNRNKVLNNYDITHILKELFKIYQEAIK